MKPEQSFLAYVTFTLPSESAMQQTSQTKLAVTFNNLAAMAFALIRYLKE